MADVIKFDTVTPKFACGGDFNNISVINITGPDGAKACAYSCNMNIDNDGEPQAYAPFSKPWLRPKDVLGNAGWKGDQNSAIKANYEAGKIALAALETQKATLLAAVKPAAAGPPKPPDPAVAALDKEIASRKKVLANMSFAPNSDTNKTAVTPKNFEQIFWQWYGVTALTPEEARSKPAYLEMTAPRPILRKPKLFDKPKSTYEDAFGRFPVVQSDFEPGPEYFVSHLPTEAANPRYPEWDQRCFIPRGELFQQAYGALSIPLAKVTGLAMNDNVFAIRLDTNDTLTFPFRDKGNDLKVAECSFAAFTGLGGEYHPENERAAKFPNKFLLLYLAFPGGQSPATVLSKFSTATNAAELPVMLAFIAQATVDAQAKHTTMIGGDPKHAFERWKKSSPQTPPPLLNVILQGLANAGNDFVKHMMKTHPSLLGEGPFLQPPTQP